MWPSYEKYIQLIEYTGLKRIRIGSKYQAQIPEITPEKNTHSKDDKIQHFEAVNDDEILRLEADDNKIMHDTLNVISKKGKKYPKLEAQHSDMHVDVIYSFEYIIVPFGRTRNKKLKFVHIHDIEALVFPCDVDFEELQLVIHQHTIRITPDFVLSKSFLESHDLQIVNNKFSYVEA